MADDGPNQSPESKPGGRAQHQADDQPTRWAEAISRRFIDKLPALRVCPA